MHKQVASHISCHEGKLFRLRWIYDYVFYLSHLSDLARVEDTPNNGPESEAQNSGGGVDKLRLERR